MPDVGGGRNSTAPAPLSPLISNGKIRGITDGVIDWLSR